MTPRMLRYRESLGLLPPLRQQGAAGAAASGSCCQGSRGTHRPAGQAGRHRQFGDADLAAVALGVAIERRYDISPVALAFGITRAGRPASPG